MFALFRIPVFQLLLHNVQVTAASSPSQRKTILSTEHLTRLVEGRAIVNDISVEVHAAEVLAVVGPSGAGKSSFLRLLNRLDEPTSGTVFVDGSDYRQISPRDLRRRVGMVTQRPFLFPGTVADNLRFGPRQRGELLADSPVESVLSRVGLSGYASREITNLSGGEAQRVSLARALANSPEVLLMDEPTSALDESSKLEVESLIRDVIRDSHLTCVIVTHDFAQAARMAESALVLEVGRAVRNGPIHEVLHA
ncbi:MAG TPA: phosphate ABC transporter ATP-binding protein [Terriglobales bacterium]